MLRNMVVGVDGSAYSTTALELAIRWAQRWEAELVGLGIVDAPTICKAQPVSLGGSAYKVRRDATLLVDASHTVTQLLKHTTLRCAAAGVTSQARQVVGAPTTCLLLEAHQSDLLVLGQQTFFHFATQDTPDDTLAAVVKRSPCPVVAVPATLPEGRAVVVAYDGSVHATRALHLFQALGLARAVDVHVVCIAPQPQRAAGWAARALAFFQGHLMQAHVQTLVTAAAPAQVLLEQVHTLDAGLLVMGAYGRSRLREFFGTSLTRTMLEASPVPLFLYH